MRTYDLRRCPFKAMQIFSQIDLPGKRSMNLGSIKTVFEGIKSHITLISVSSFPYLPDPSLWLFPIKLMFVAGTTCISVQPAAERRASKLTPTLAEKTSTNGPFANLLGTQIKRSLCTLVPDNRKLHGYFI